MRATLRRRWCSSAATPRSPFGRSPRSGADSAVDVRTAVDCRYAGQSHEITVPSVEEFHPEHERRNGYARAEALVEVVALRATARASSSVDVERLPFASRDAVVGPTVVREPDCTIWVPEGWRGEPGAMGALVLRRA